MNAYFQKTTSAAPLAVFRIAFGLLLFGSMVRFMAKGWVAELYIKPKYFFPFYGFEFVKPFGEYTYLIFIVCALAALLVAFGCYYRMSSIVLFLSFTYIELIDKSTYLNHYYFISMLSLLMIFLPAHVLFSVDAWRNKQLHAGTIPQWTIDSVKLFVCMIYVFAGMAKINSDWLLEAQPLRTWLPASNDMPVLGPLFNHVWVAYVFSWLGCIYDLSIPFLLLSRTTRALAYLAVVCFHFLTALLFPIGMFPYIMMATALIFFPAELHKKILRGISRWCRMPEQRVSPTNQFRFSRLAQHAIVSCLIIFFALQVALPFRYLLYPGELFWTEQGYRFSWRVMLMEKAGYAQFVVKDRDGRIAVVDNDEFLTPLQEKMMATQPDMLVQYAHFLRDHYARHGFISPEVYVDSYVAVNGRLGRPLVDPGTDLTTVKDSFAHKTWILPFDNEIKGL